MRRQCAGKSHIKWPNISIHIAVSLFNGAKRKKWEMCRYYRHIACVRLLFDSLYLIFRRTSAATVRLLFVLKMIVEIWTWIYFITVRNARLIILYNPQYMNPDGLIIDKECSMIMPAKSPRQGMTDSQGPAGIGQQYTIYSLSNNE